MGRRLNTKIPTHADLLKPQTVHSETVKQKLNEKQAVQKKYYDRGTRSLSPLKPGDTVRVWNPEKKKWNPAIVESLTNKPRSYIVVTQEGSKLRRNRQDILKSDEVSFNPDLVSGGGYSSLSWVRMCGPKFRPPPYNKTREDANLLPISKPFVS